jgi:hypothetical protein
MPGEDLIGGGSGWAMVTLSVYGCVDQIVNAGTSNPR